jgi:hypothetical protein
VSNLDRKVSFRLTETSLREECVGVSIPITRAEWTVECSQEMAETSRVTNFRTTLTECFIGVRLLATVPPGGNGLVRVA